MEQRPETQFVPLPVAAAELGLTERALQRRVQAGALRVYRNPVDRRRYLVDRDDITAFLRPEPIRRSTHQTREGGAAA